MKLATLTLWIATALLGRDAAAGGLTPLVRVGDSISGLGTVTALTSRVAVDNAGNWWVLANNSSVIALISNGQVVLKTGDPLPNPPGAAVASIRNFGVSKTGDTAWTVDLSTGGTAVYWNGALAMRTGTPVLASTYPSGSTYGVLRHAQPAGFNRFMLLGSVNTVSTGPQDFLSVVTVDGAGLGVAESVRLRRNTTIILSQIVDSVPVRPEHASIDDAGGTTFSVASLNRSWIAATINGCQVGSLCTFLLDSWLNGPTGEPLGELFGAGLHSNSVGHWVSKARAGTQNTVRICGNFGASDSITQLYGPNSAVSGISPWVVESILFDAPIFLTQNNQVVWYANWTDPVTTRDEGILINNELIVQEGVTATSVGTLQTVDPYGFAVSDNGRYLVFRGRLEGGVEGAFHLDLAPAVAYCFGDGTGTPCPCGGTGSATAGCPHSSNAGGARLAMKIGGSACVSVDTVTLEVSNAPGFVSVLFFQGTNRWNAGAGSVFGDGLRCAGGTFIRLGTKVTNGGVARYPAIGDMSVSLRGAVPVAGGIRTYQVWYRNAADFCTTSTFNLTNGLEIAWLP